MVIDFKLWLVGHPQDGVPPAKSHMTHMMVASGQIYLCCETCGFAMSIDDVAAGFPVEREAALKFQKRALREGVGKVFVS